MQKDIIKAVELLKKSKYAVAFTGAGISVESGIPPFRGEGGLWNKYDPQIFELSYFTKYPEKSWLIIKEIFYKYFGKVKPNTAHIVLAKMEQAGIIKTIITQNIDNLHQEAGGRNVYEFHGNSHTLVCMKCHTRYKINEVDLTEPVPSCKKCTSILKPDFIFFGEGIPEPAGSQSFAEAIKSDVFLIIGTSGEVVPASFIPHEAKRTGSVIIEINPNETTYTNAITDIFLQGKATEIMTEIDKYIFFV